MVISICVILLMNLRALLDARELVRCYLQVFGRYEASQEIKTDNAKVFTSELIN